MRCRVDASAAVHCSSNLRQPARPGPAGPAWLQSNSSVVRSVSGAPCIQIADRCPSISLADGRTDVIRPFIVLVTDARFSAAKMLLAVVRSIHSTNGFHFPPAATTHGLACLYFAIKPHLLTRFIMHQQHRLDIMYTIAKKNIKPGYMGLKTICSNNRELASN